MFGIKRFIQKIIKLPEDETPICDPYAYDNRQGGYAGGSLQGQNILIVTNSSIKESVIEDILALEDCSAKMLFLPKGELTKQHIAECGENILGPFTHIINVVYGDDVDNHEPQSTAYQWMQVQTEYLVSREQYGTICTTLIAKEDCSAEVKAKLFAAENMVRGLGLVMASHGVIVNGVSADENVGLSNVMKAATYMCSKYGQILAGEVLNLPAKTC